MAKLRIALCITDLDVGGAERALVELATRLDRDRFDPAVYCLAPRPSSLPASCVPRLESAGIEVHCLGATGSRQVLPVVGRLKTLLTDRRPDLFQSFLFHANLVGRLAARRAGVRPVVSGIRVAEPRRWHLWADRLTGSLVDRYVCVSQSVARFSVSRARLPAEKLVVIPNGVDLDRFGARSPVDRSSLGVAEGRRMVIYVGRLEQQKGVGWLLASAPLWLKRLPDCDLVLVGTGPDRPELEQTVGRQGTSGRIHFAGWRSDVPEILAASELLVLPSRWEGMPNVVLEAMASGLPVVASDVEGVRELLGPAADGQTVRHGDSEELAEKIVRLVSDDDLPIELRRQNRERAVKEFNFDRVVGSYQDLWESLAGS